MKSPMAFPRSHNRSCLYNYGPGQLTVNGAFTWSTGSLQGSGTVNIPPGGSMTIDGQVVLNQRTINNSGSINWTSQFYSLAASGGAVINNLSGALFNMEPGAEIAPGGLPLATFNNFGTVQKAAGSGGVPFYLNFNNAGLFQVLTGSVSFPYTFQQTSGRTIVGSGATFTGTGGIDLLGGSLGGAGTISGPVTNSGVVHPGMSPGILTLVPVYGTSYTQSVAGTLNIEIGGPMPGTQYSQLAAAGVPVSLGGSLDVSLVNGFLPSPGQEFTILKCGSRTGTFPVLNGTYLGNGVALVPVYSNTNVVLVVSNVVVLLPPIAFARVGPSGNNLQLTWQAVIGQQYQVEYSSNLFHWFVLSNFIASGTSASALDPAPIPGVPKRFYRLR
jgi:hypothetical protein